MTYGISHIISYRSYINCIIIYVQSRLASSRASLPNYSQIFDSAILEKAEDEGNGNKRVFYPSTSLSKYNYDFEILKIPLGRIGLISGRQETGTPNVRSPHPMRKIDSRIIRKQGGDHRSRFVFVLLISKTFCCFVSLKRINTRKIYMGRLFVMLF